MPRGDRTGPLGMGPMTGRGAGFCAGFGSIKPGIVYGRRRGGRGFGGKPGFAGFPEEINASVADEKEYLGNQVKILENKLQKVKQRFEALDDTSE